MSGHTPGTWWVNPLNAQVDALPSLVPVCHLLWPTDERTEAETAANARLIAAAPDMHKALETFMQAHDEADPLAAGMLAGCAYEMAREALQKAGGAP